MIERFAGDSGLSVVCSVLPLARNATTLAPMMASVEPVTLSRQPYLENALASQLSLDGDWAFRLGSGSEQRIAVPSAWEAHVSDKITDGPAVYRRTFTRPEDWLGARIVLEAQAISFDAVISINGQVAGRHRGMWSPFQVEITALVRPGENQIDIEVWKPGARFPVREALAGFLPDVCTTFGGIWQSLRLCAFRRVALHNLRVGPINEFQAPVRFGVVWLDNPVIPGSFNFVLEILDRHGRCISATPPTSIEAANGLANVVANLPIPEAQDWSPNAPTLYSVRVSVCEGETCLAQALRRTGFRQVQARQAGTWLNDRPIHFRGVLDWGWNPERLAPTFSREELLDNFAKARALGFNLIKLCLVVPDETFFDVADESGMLLWLELPLWLPRLTPEARALVAFEYDTLFRRLQHHPSIVIVSLGCEMNSEADAIFLKELAESARACFPHSLHCDNSGSAEAYGGALTHLSDFYDYHFYTDPHFFASLADHFHRDYRIAKPWIYGEFCDADTLRDFSQLKPLPWWLTENVALERDDYLSLRDHSARLRAANVTDGGAALTRIARQQATPVRKFILEHVRSRHATGGYVLTGWRDTPITTSGVVDDQRQLKFSPADWRPFNADRVLLIDRERRRRWIGGDRPARRDPFSWWQGERAEVHVLFSNGSDATPPGPLDWSLSHLAGEVVARGGVDVPGVEAGQVSELAVLGLEMPHADRPIELVLRITVSAVSNTWRLWAVPRVVLSHAPSPSIVSELSDTVLDDVRAGGFAVLWQTQPDPRLTRSVPFWREAIHVFEPHPWWQQVPHAGYADMRFFSVATDLAFDRRALQSVLGVDITPIWRRFDARQMRWAEYIAEAHLGAGRLFLSTLRFAGGLGYQPDSLDTNPWGTWLLASLLETVRRLAPVSHHSHYQGDL